MMSNTLGTLLLVSAGGFAGAVARYWISSRIAERLKTSLPYGTLTVNLAGSFLLGILWGGGADGRLMALLGSGFMGAFTTFSTLKLESEALLHQGESRTAWLYMGLSYILGLLLAYAGYTLSLTYIKL
ncbi:fluoride efflux transporter CrcB [Paenibacillus elgii]|uniref:Fluoride-specific ion channel FluC n=1 Tax=Paenibacillus elgii TaxID=189691 RepID=A0A2T6FUB7_9BACL|nr:fluoride efflux transporter CrcB [Paenibacillus elgii]PUA35499.1 fluoride efflux transporter CrcB [Paenibacillus elgii]